MSDCEWGLTRCQADDMWYCQTHGYADANNENLGTTPTTDCPVASIKKWEQERDRLAKKLEEADQRIEFLQRHLNKAGTRRDGLAEEMVVVMR